MLSGLFFSLILGQENGGKPSLKGELRLPPGQDFSAFWERSNQPDKWPEYRFPRERRFPLERTAMLPHQGNRFFPGEKDFYNSGYPFSPVTANASDSVQHAWVSHYASGILSGVDSPAAMTVDGQGNIYVTGFNPGIPFGRDYFTIKYTSDGAEIWSVRYSEGIENIPRDIAVDTAGNVYVTGESEDSETAYDYATVKYHSAGVQQWVARYDGPGNSDDRPTAIVLDVS